MAAAQPARARPRARRSPRPSPPPAGLPARPTDCFYYLVSRATLVATAVLRNELDAASDHRVKPAYLGALMALWNGDGLAASALARRAGLGPSAMTGLIDRMERDGLVARRPDPADRRAHRIRLTAEGRRLREPVLGVVARTLAMASAGTSEAELAVAKDVLRRFLANMRATRRGLHE